jgi:hypothetical protein
LPISHAYHSLGDGAWRSHGALVRCDVNGEERATAVGANLCRLVMEYAKDEARRANIDAHHQRARLDAHKITIGHRDTIGDVLFATSAPQIVRREPAQTNAVQHHTKAPDGRNTRRSLNCTGALHRCHRETQFLIFTPRRTHAAILWRRYTTIARSRVLLRLLAGPTARHHLREIGNRTVPDCTSCCAAATVQWASDGGRASPPRGRGLRLRLARESRAR